MDQIFSYQNFWKIGRATLKELETDQGFLASGREELFGCIFGRDTLLTSLSLLKIYNRTKDPELLCVARKALLTLAALQGTEENIESGEEPGKCIHEYRSEDHEHLTKHSTDPWFTYPDGSMKIYDTVDATPLFLVAAYRFYQASKDENFLNAVLPSIHAALEWLIRYGDKNGDTFIDYELNPRRKHGGLRVQSWMDSSESLFSESMEEIVRPIAPVEVQAYAYLAFRLWANFFKTANPGKAAQLDALAGGLKENFNHAFTVRDEHGRYLAFALDGHGRQLTSSRSSMGHCLWASQSDEEDGVLDGILDSGIVAEVVDRLMGPDMFEEQAGIRTLSIRSRAFDPVSYHNGSIWPHDNAMIVEGLEAYGFKKEADKVKRALSKSYTHYKMPLELYGFADGTYKDYPHACKKQAWSAAALMSLAAPERANKEEPALAEEKN